MSTQIRITVPPEFEPDVLERIIDLRRDFEPNTLIIEVTHDKQDLPMGEDEERPAPRRAAPRPRADHRPAPRPVDGPRGVVRGPGGRFVQERRHIASGPAEPERVGLTPRASVLYRTITDQEPTSPVNRRIFVFLTRSGELTAREIMEWVAQQDNDTVEGVRKSVESALHTMRTRGYIESVPAPQVQAADRR